MSLLSSYRQTVARLTRERASLEQQLGRERERLARLQGEYANHVRDASRATSQSSADSRRRQAQAKQRDIAQAQKRIGDLSSRIAQKLRELARASDSAERLEAQGTRQRAAAAKRERAEEIRHVQRVTAETAQQARLHDQMHRSPIALDVRRLPTTIRVLFLAANPGDLTQLRLDEEIRSITETIRLSEYRDAVELTSRWAVRPADLQQALNEIRPHVVHFSGHGGSTGEILLQNADGSSKPVSVEALAATLGVMADNIRLVVFNACFSAVQAQAVAQHVEAAIGMQDVIGDEAARLFAAQLYSAIGFGRSLGEAFDQAKARLQLEGIPEEHTPELRVQDGVDPYQLVLVRPSQAA